MTTGSISHRKCSVCKKSLPLTSEHWHKDRQALHGLCYRCKECTKFVKQKWVDDNRERAREYRRQYYAENRERFQEYKRENAGLITEQKRQWRKSNPEMVKRHKLASQRRHPESHTRRQKRWRKNRPEADKAIVHRRLARKANAHGTHTADDIRDLYELQNGHCAYCGITIYFDLPKDIHTDHMTPLSRTGGNSPDNLVLACEDCNLSKGSKTPAEWEAMRGW